METFLLTVHVCVSITLILIVLIQTGKGAEMGAAFGGAAQTVFGGSGPAPLLGKITTFSAVIFMVTSLSLAYLSANPTGGSIMKGVKTVAPIQATVPVEAPGNVQPNAVAPQGETAPAENN
jgi:preprotein translocase subunit SecG